MIVKTNPDEFESYLSDASNYKGHCEQVLIPGSIDELVGIIRTSNLEQTPITISGNGTGLNGGRCPDGGIVISMSAFNKILKIDKKRNMAIVEAGVLLEDLQTALGEQGFFYPPDPTEQMCFIGATIATNASGAKSFSYGPTRNFVNALDVLLADGSVLHVTRGQIKAVNYQLALPLDCGVKTIALPSYVMPDVKNSAGYYTAPDMDAIDMFIGSEGTLGIILRAELNILPVPEKILSCVVFFKDEDDSLAFISGARNFSGRFRCPTENNPLNARALEFFDYNAIEFLRKHYTNIPSVPSCAVWFEQECSVNDEEELLEQWLDLIEKYNGMAETVWCGIDAIERKRITEFRHAISSLINDYISAHNFRKLGTDTAVPAEKFIEFYKNSKMLVEQAGLSFVAYGHFGDCHLHLNMLPKTAVEMETGRMIYRAICSLAISLGGTVSAEHGIGKSKRDLLELMYGKNNISKMKALKANLDPCWILNRGNLFLPV